MTIFGRLERVFLGGPAWIVQVEDGPQWQVVGEIPPELEGQLVAVEGRPAEAQFGLTMAGPIFEAQSIRAQ